jgi:amylosucrase
VYNQTLHQQINRDIAPLGLDIADKDNSFYARLIGNATNIQLLYRELYAEHPKGKRCFDKLINTICEAYTQRSQSLRKRDRNKLKDEAWFTSNQLMGMSLYVDRFAGSLEALKEKLPYLEELGVNLLHLMPIFESPANASDGGYAVSNFRKVDARFGTLEDLQQLQKQMLDKGMYLMLDIVLNHTSDRHEWAMKAKEGDPFYGNFFYTYPDRKKPDAFEASMPEVFPENAPGSFTWNAEMKRWVMTVFHSYQWDLNFANPEVLIAMLENIFFYANMGVDVLRIDAPAFIWKQMGTTCQNLPQAHTLLRLIRMCVEVATPGMALLGEAIVAPAEIMKYFGLGRYEARECHFAYNATQMALLWDALATSDTRILLNAQGLLGQKPAGASWITYTRCHDDIGLGYDDAMIAAVGFNPFEHRRFIKDYYSGAYNGSPASGALFAANPKTGDARISGSLASLCGLEKALVKENDFLREMAIRKILLMQAFTMFSGGLPMLFYGDEAGYTNDYSYLNDTAKSYDNRWMHRPVIDWKKNERRYEAETCEAAVFAGTQKLIALRKQLAVLSDESNIVFAGSHNRHSVLFARYNAESRLYFVFNFSDRDASLSWYAFRETGCKALTLQELWEGKEYAVGADEEYLVIQPFRFLVFGEG